MLGVAVSAEAMTNLMAGRAGKLMVEVTGMLQVMLLMLPVSAVVSVVGLLLREMVMRLLLPVVRVVPHADTTCSSGGGAG